MSLKESIWSSKHAFNIVFNIVINIVCNMEACPENWKGCGQNSRTRNTSLISLFTWASCNKEVITVDVLYSMPFLSWKKTPDQATKSYILYMISYAMRYCGSTYDIVYRPTTSYVFAMTLYMHIQCRMSTYNIASPTIYINLWRCIWYVFLGVYNIV